MTMTNARFDRELPALIEDLYLGPTPSYRDEVLAVATLRRQRPAWAVPGRWLPMADIASRPAFAPRVPWRTVGVALVIIAVLLAAIAVYAGTRQTKLPPPFGVARNGLVAYTAHGDIYVEATAKGTVRQLTNTPARRDGLSSLARLAAPGRVAPAGPDRPPKRLNPGWSGPGFRVHSMLVAGRGFEPLTFGL
jgi:hypothetical protein